ncbi:uncharacterized protein LOC126839133 isoform X2 [Adelges cooleyi]|uniref:uncharacterized protein LOC126839133 isoform X2 n=1 Tax=Adelges cooleyi TaxID=133065 RepID=UPI00218028D1|nr:uncharacterized protein LOC126839133 isoform X2 [Adelges cooleyi]
MKIFCLLVTFLFLVDIFANDYDDYLYSVYITTGAIKQASTLNDLSVGNRARKNRLEHLIETLVDNSYNGLDYKDFCKINFLIAVPDQTDIVSEIADEIDKEGLKKAIYYLRNLIQDIESIIRCVFSVFKEDLGTLEELADERRDFVVPAIIRIMRRRLSDGTLNHEAYLLPQCRLLGLYLSTQLPHLYIKEVEIDLTYRKCILIDNTKGKMRLDVYESNHIEHFERLPL